MRPVAIGLVGVGGYARSYLRTILALHDEGILALKSVVIRTPGKYPEQEKQVADKGVPVRGSFEEMIEKDGKEIEIAAIPTGIDSHRDLVIQAVEAGCNVILEKPSAATVQDIDAMLGALDRTGKFCTVGFQSQSNPVVLALKKAICDGRLGGTREVVVTGCWERTDSYYARNPWAGRFRLNDRYILDGTINNPLAHYLFNGLFFASQECGRAAVPASVRAELYRGHRIESEDTSCLEITCDNGARVHFYATLCSETRTMPLIEVIGEKGYALHEEQGTARIFEGGSLTEEITMPEGANPREEVFRNAARYVRGLDSELNCPLRMTRSHVLAVNGAFESAAYPATIAEHHLKHPPHPETADRCTHIRGIKELIDRASAQRKLFSDLGIPWAVRTKPFSLKDYKRFALKRPDRLDFSST